MWDLHDVNLCPYLGGKWSAKSNTIFTSLTFGKTFIAIFSVGWNLWIYGNPLRQILDTGGLALPCQSHSSQTPLNRWLKGPFDMLPVATSFTHALLWLKKQILFWANPSQRGLRSIKDGSQRISNDITVTWEHVGRVPVIPDETLVCCSVTKLPFPSLLLHFFASMVWEEGSQLEPYAPCNTSTLVLSWNWQE